MEESEASCDGVPMSQTLRETFGVDEQLHEQGPSEHLNHGHQPTHTVVGLVSGNLEVGALLRIANAVDIPLPAGARTTAANPAVPGAGMPCVNGPLFGRWIKDPSNEPGFMGLAYPETYFSGECEFTPLGEPRAKARQPKLKDYLEHVLKSRLRLSQHPTYGYFWFQTMRTKALSKVAGVYVDINYADMTRGELKAKMNDPDPDVRNRVMNGMRGHTADIPGTAGYHRGKRIELRGLINHYEFTLGGSAAFFPTMTSADVHSYALHSTLALLRDPTADISDVASLGGWQSRFDNLANDPRGAQYMAAQLLLKVNELAMATLLGVDESELLHMIRCEWQGRTQVRCHVS